MAAAALSPQELSNLIGSIYDCALDPSRWEQTLDEIRRAFDGLTAILHLNDLCENRVLINRTVGISPHWLEQINEHSVEINTRLMQDLASFPSVDEPHLISRHLPHAYVNTSPYIQNCLKPNGICDVITYFLMHTPARFAGFALGRHERQGIFTDGEIELGSLLLPHLRRAVTISNALDVSKIEGARMTQTLDALRCGVVLTDERATILHANRSAELMLREGNLIQGIRGRLQTKAQSAAAELRAAIRVAARDEAAIGKTGLAICLTESDSAPVFAHVLPMTGGKFRTQLQPAAVASVFIGAMPDGQDGAATLAAAYDLTPAETRVLASLLKGRTLAETATSLGIAATTAKTHLENVFLKTGVTRQTDLMRLGTRLVPPTRL